jgi:hypothetical protein
MTLTSSPDSSRNTTLVSDEHGLHVGNNEEASDEENLSFPQKCQGEVLQNLSLCKKRATVDVWFNGMSLQFCDGHAQKYLGSTKSFFAIYKITRRGCENVVP